MKAQVDYIHDENPAAAERLAKRIREVCTALGDVPTGRQGRVAGTFEKVVAGTPYIIAYAVGPIQAEKEIVTVLRVIHGARDWRPGEWPE